MRGFGVPRSSAWPSKTTVADGLLFIQVAQDSMVLRDCGCRSAWSNSKKTRSFEIPLAAAAEAVCWPPPVADPLPSEAVSHPASKATAAIKLKIVFRGIVSFSITQLDGDVDRCDSAAYIQ